MLAPRILFVAGREASYVRNRLILRAIGPRYAVRVVASAAPTYVSRMRDALYGLARFGRSHDLIVAGFFGQPIALAAAHLLRKPVLLDAFISAYDTLCLDRRTANPASAIGRLAFQLDRRACLASRAIMVDTACQCQFFSATFGIPRDRIIVHYLGPDLPMAQNEQRAAGRRDHGRTDATTPGRALVLSYSSFLPLHGAEVVAHAARLLAHRPDIAFTFVGQGPRRRTVAEIARGLPNVRLVPWLDPVALQTAIDRSTVGLGGHFADNPKARRVIAGKSFQLLASGRATIVGDCPANRELFTPDTDVLAVPMGAPRALAEAICELVDDPARRAGLAQNGARLMRETFASDRVAGSLDRAIALALG